MLARCVSIYAHVCAHTTHARTFRNHGEWIFQALFFPPLITRIWVGVNAGVFVARRTAKWTCHFHECGIRVALIILRPLRAIVFFVHACVRANVTCIGASAHHEIFIGKTLSICSPLTAHWVLVFANRMTDTTARRTLLKHKRLVIVAFSVFCPRSAVHIDVHAFVTAETAGVWARI